MSVNLPEIFLDIPFLLLVFAGVSSTADCWPCRFHSLHESRLRRLENMKYDIKKTVWGQLSWPPYTKPTKLLILFRHWTVSAKVKELKESFSATHRKQMALKCPMLCWLTLRYRTPSESARVTVNIFSQLQLESVFTILKWTITSQEWFSPPFHLLKVTCLLPNQSSYCLCLYTLHSSKHASLRASGT